MAYKPKYFAKKIVIDGEKFDSYKEHQKWMELKEMEQRGEISNLQRQVKFEVLPPQFDENGKIVYRAVHYVADMTWIDKDGNFIVADVKSPMTRKLPEYKIKKKLLYYTLKIKLLEIL